MSKPQVTYTECNDCDGRFTIVHDSEYYVTICPSCGSDDLKHWIVEYKRFLSSANEEDDDRICAYCAHRGDEHDDYGVCEVEYCKCVGWTEA